MATSKRKDFTQTALDVVRQATGERPAEPLTKPREAAAKTTKGAAKKAAKKN